MNISSNKTKLSDLLEQGYFTEAMLLKDPTLAKEFGDEKAREYANKLAKTVTPRFKEYKESSRIDDRTPKVNEYKDKNFGTPPITRTKNNTINTDAQDNLGEYGEGDNQVNLNNVQIDPNTDITTSKSELESKLKENKKELIKVEKLLTTTGVNDASTSKFYADRKKRLKIEQSSLENQLSQNSGIGKIKTFEDKTGFNFNGLDNNSKAKEIARIEDAYNSYSDNYLTFQNFYQDENAALKGASEQLQSENVNINSITDEKGGTIKIKNGTLKYDGFWNNKNLEDFNVKGINPYNGKVIAEYDGRQIEYYPNDQAQDFGQDLAEHNANLKTNGFSVTTGYDNQPYLVVKKFNPAARNKTLQNGSYQDVALPIPPEYIEKIKGMKNADDAMRIFDDLSLEYEGSILNDKMMVDLMREAGDVFEYSTKEELKNN